MFKVRRYLFAIFVFILTTTIGVPTSTAQSTIHVPGDQPTIQNAIFAANNGDTIVVAPGNYSETLNFVGKAVVVESSDGAAATTISAQGGAWAVTFQSGEGNGAVLRGFTIQNPNGGDIMVSGSSPVIEKNIIQNGVSCGGGAGILLSFSSAIVRNDVITGNQEFCSGNGGGISVQGEGAAQILNNTVTSNQDAIGNGAGIGLQDAGTPVISGNIVRNNTATTGGGGGIYASGDSSPVISNNLVESNQAFSGGGVYLFVSNATLVNNTIANNAVHGPSPLAPQVYADGANLGINFFNNILFDRTGQGAVFCGPSNSTIPTFSDNDVVSFDPNIPGQPLTEPYTGICTDMTGVNGNIQQDPLFVNGFTAIPDFNGDFHLQAGSPAIDAGLSTAPNLPALDLDGNPRIAAGNAITCNAIVDMGAYEFLTISNGIANLFPASISFGSGQIGLPPNTSGLTLSASQGCVQVRSITATGDFQASGNCSALFAGSSCTIQVVFEPKVPGLRTGSLVVDLGPGTPPLTATFTGEGVNSGSVSPTSLNFGVQPLQSISPAQLIQIMNAPGVPMQINSITITGDFSQTNSCSFPNTGIVCFVDVAFSPTATGARTGTLTINTSQGVFTIPLTGDGAAPTPTLSPSALLFPSQTIGSTSPAQTVTLSNDGTADLFVNGFNTTGDFQAIPVTCTGFLSSGTSCTFAITFTPSVAGPRSGMLEVDTNGGPATIALSGTGTPAIATLMPQLLAFNPQQFETASAPQTVSVVNISGAPLQINSISTADNFLATSSCPAMLDTNASCSIDVSLAPTSLNPTDGVLSIGTNLGTVTAILTITHRTIRVPADAGSINQAVSLAQDGDTVLVAPGTYSEQVSFQGKAITIAGAGGAAVTVLDGGGFSTPFFAFNQEGPRSVLKGFTLTHGSNGALLISGASPTIQDNIITNSTGCSGGGIELFSSSSVISHNTISNNSVPTFCGFNAAGGGIEVSGLGPNGPAQITGNTILGNQVPLAQGGGGGIAVINGFATITGNTIQNNTTSGNGGGIWVTQSSTVDLIQNLITGNSATSGGGIYHTIDFSPSLVLNNTIAGNSALTGSAAFMDGFDAGVTVKENLLIDDTGVGAVACSFNSGQIPTFSFNDVFSAGNPNLAYTLACPDMTGISFNIKQDPQFVDAASDFHLLAGSPAIDAGDASVLDTSDSAKVPSLDLDGKGRFGPGNATTCRGVIDLGAYEFTLNASGIVAPLPSTVDFGSANVGNFGSSFGFPISVQGCVQVASVKVTGDFQQTNTCSNAASSAGACVIQVNFAPTNSGPRTGTMTVDFGSSSPAQTVTLTGQGIGSSLVATSPSLQFADQPIQTSSPVQTVNIFSFGQPAVVNTVWITGDFAQTTGCPFPSLVAAGCSISVVFTPTAFGPRTGALNISSNEGTLIIPLAGNGTGTPVASVSPTSLSFPSQPLNTTSAAQQITLRNTGTDVLLPGTFTLSGDFIVVPSAVCGTGLAPGASCTYSFTFTPTAEGSRTGIFSLQTNGGSVSVSLNGTGLAAVASVSPQSLSFAPQVLLTSSATQTVTLGNSGNLPLAIASIAVSGDFAQTNNCGTSLAAGAACSINVIFTPTAAGTRTANLAIATNGGSFSVGLSGIGATATAQVTPQSLPFGSELVNTTSSARTVTLTAGVNLLQISSISASGDFTETNNCGATLSPSVACTIQVTFTPAATGSRSGALTVTSNEGSLTVPLSGTGLVRDPNAIYVPVDQGTIQAAINAAANGQSVLVFSGTYAERINFNGKAITVASTDGPASTTIDGGLTGTVVTFSTGETAASVLRGFTITRGTSTFEGSGILVSSASPTIDSNVITANQGCGGIGIGIAFASPVIRNNTISNNKQTTCSGGGGGGISVRGAGSPQILNNTITGNHVDSGGDGGGIGVNGSTSTISGNVIRGNTAFNDGGGISVVNDSPSNIVENLITGNTSASGNGGGLYLLVPSGARGPFMVSNTVAGNIALSGSATFVDGFPATTKIVNNIFVGSPGAVALECSGLRSSAPPLLSFNDAFSAGGTGYDGTCAALAGTAGNISLDPQFVNAANNNFRLQAASPAIDAGNNSDPNLPALDLDGNPRIAFGNAATCVNTVDLGVYEFALTTPTTATLTPSSFDFGVVPVGTSSTAQSFTVTATQGCVKVDSVAATGDFSQTNNCSSILATGASCTVQATFTPSAGGVRSSSLNVQSGNSALTANLTGTGGVAAATFAPTALSFGNQLVGTTSATQVVTLNNTGNVPLTITGFAINGDFAQTNTCTATLAPGASCTISVAFTPTARLIRTGTLNIQSNSTPPPANVSLSGTGIAPIATLTASLSFAPQVVGATKTQTATLTNAGDAPLAINSISASGDFAQSNTCPAILAAGSSCSIQVSFTPSAAGPRSGALAVNDNDPASHSQTTVLSGAGLDYTISASPASATVRAGSTANYTITAAGLGGTFPGAISLSCSGLPTNATCAFSPASVSPGATTASSALQLSTSNGQHGTKKTPGGTYTITIKGTSGNRSHTTSITLVVQ